MSRHFTSTIALGRTYSLAALLAGWPFLVGSAEVGFLRSKSDADVPPLNARVVRFCEDRLGKKVGNGECATLARRALEAAGATIPAAEPKPDPSLDDDDYVWGRLLDAEEEILPGDVMQFREVKLERVGPGNARWSWSYPHHTAVVGAVLGKRHLRVLHQNVGGPDVSDDERRRVRAEELDLEEMTQGQVWFFRPIE
jgi:hypothetical protein